MHLKLMMHVRGLHLKDAPWSQWCMHIAHMGWGIQVLCDRHTTVMLNMEWKTTSVRMMLMFLNCGRSKTFPPCWRFCKDWNHGLRQDSPKSQWEVDAVLKPSTDPSISRIHHTKSVIRKMHHPKYIIIKNASSSKMHHQQNASSETPQKQLECNTQPHTLSWSLQNPSSWIAHLGVLQFPCS